MSETVSFIVNRAVRTISAAKQVAITWTWPEETPEQMQTQLETITGNSSVTPPVVGQMEIVSQSKRLADAASGQWETQLGELHRRTVQGLGMARNKFRNVPASLAVLGGLTAKSHSHSETLAEALAWESAWNQLAPAWIPTTINTLAAFKALRKQCAEDLQTAFSDAHADWRTEVEKLNSMADDLEQADEAWYADATRVFPAGTAEGDMIRSTVPTTYVPTTTKTSPAPAPTTATGKTP